MGNIQQFLGGFYCFLRSCNCRSEFRSNRCCRGSYHRGIAVIGPLAFAWSGVLHRIVLSHRLRSFAGRRRIEGWIVRFLVVFGHCQICQTQTSMLCGMSISLSTPTLVHNSLIGSMFCFFGYEVLITALSTFLPERLEHGWRQWRVHAPGC